MRLFQAALDTCLDSPFFASLSIHGLHFTVYAPSNLQFVPQHHGPRNCHLCKACRCAAVKFCPEIARGSRHGKCREISGEILLFLFSQQTKLESTQSFSRQISRHFSRGALPLQMPNFMAFFTLQTFVPENCDVNNSQSGIIHVIAIVT